MLHKVAMPKEWLYHDYGSSMESAFNESDKESEQLLGALVQHVADVDIVLSTRLTSYGILWTYNQKSI